MTQAFTSTHIKQSKTSISTVNKFRLSFSRIKKRSIIGAPRTEGEAAGLQLSAPNAKFKKNTHFVDTIISTGLCDMHFNLKQPLISADDQYNAILKNAITTYEYNIFFFFSYY